MLQHEDSLTSQRYQTHLSRRSARVQRSVSLERREYQYLVLVVKYSNPFVCTYVSIDRYSRNLLRVF